MRITSVGVGLAAVLLLAGCSSGGESAPEDAESAGTSVVSASPTTPAGPSIIKKAIGEQGGLGCIEGAEGFSDCDVQFTVTSITRGEDCSYEPLPADREVVRFDMDVETLPVLKSPEVSSIFYSQYWSVVGADGYLEKDPDMAIGCDSSMNGVWQTLEPGTRTRSSVPIIVPKGAKTLRLSQNGNGWEWEIPA